MEMILPLSLASIIPIALVIVFGLVRFRSGSLGRWAVYFVAGILVVYIVGIPVFDYFQFNLTPTFLRLSVVLVTIAFHAMFSLFTRSGFWGYEDVEEDLDVDNDS